MDEETRKSMNTQLDLVLTNLSETESKLKSMLTNFRQAVHIFKEVVNNLP